MNSHTSATQTNIYQRTHKELIPEYMHTYSFHILIYKYKYTYIHSKNECIHIIMYTIFAPNRELSQSQS